MKHNEDDNKIGIVKVISMKNTVDNLSKSKVILMCGPAGAGKSTLAKKFESTGMTILSYDEESFKRGLNEHPLPQEVLEDIKTYLDEKLISLIMPLSAMSFLMTPTLWI